MVGKFDPVETLHILWFEWEIAQGLSETLGSDVVWKSYAKKRKSVGQYCNKL